MSGANERARPFLCHVKLLDPGALLHHNEPFLRNGAVIDYVASGAFAYVQVAAIGTYFINANNRASIEMPCCLH